MIEPENDELVQVSYLCDMDSQIWEDELLNECGDIRSVGMANDKVFMSLGKSVNLLLMSLSKKCQKMT